MLRPGRLRYLWYLRNVRLYGVLRSIMRRAKNRGCLGQTGPRIGRACERWGGFWGALSIDERVAVDRRTSVTSEQLRQGRCGWAVSALHRRSGEPRTVTRAGLVAAISVFIAQGGVGKAFVVRNAMPASGQELGELLFRRQRDQIAIGPHLMGVQFDRPGGVVGVLETAETFACALDIEPLSPGGVGMIASVPADKHVAVGGDQLEGIAQPPANRDVHYGHGRTRSA